MALDMTSEQRTVGEANFKKATEHLGLNRRTFLKAGVAVAGTAAAAYFGYRSLPGRPVKAALIGTGDEGGVLASEHNPEFLNIVAVCDIRPSNLKRIFTGDPGAALRRGLNAIYGSECNKSIAQYDDYDKFIEALEKDSEIEAVIIALPLHLHARATVDCMRAGARRKKPVHVLCEKLMAWNIRQCKQMIQVARETGSLLSIGHQRHYSLLYAQALEVVNSGALGEVKHIRALWHRNFSWPYRHDVKKGPQVDGPTRPTIRDGWFQPVLVSDYKGLEKQAKQLDLDLGKYLEKCGYTGKTPEEAVAQLIRWRLHAETGGGLMAELGSHQLDACSIFLGKVHPLSVQGYGGRMFFDGPGGRKNPRDIDDHVFATYEFPGKNYFARDDNGNIRLGADKEPVVKDRNDVCVVTYSSVSTNSFEQYGECLMGTRGTMIVEAEQRVLLFPEKDPTKRGDQRTMTVDVNTMKKGDAAADSTSTWGGPVAAPAAAGGSSGSAGGPVSRGYREEMEDFAYCIRLLGGGPCKYDGGDQKSRLPRCHGEVAMADAIVALTANRAMHGDDGRPQRIDFKPEWFVATSSAVPPEGKPKIEVKTD